MDHAFSWLSTLGGAFSALGDYFENCAETAGKISIQQLQLAFRLGRFYQGIYNIKFNHQFNHNSGGFLNFCLIYQNTNKTRKPL